MSNPYSPNENDRHSDSPFDQLVNHASDEASFTVGFRGYDRREVDATLADLTARLQRAEDGLAETELQHRSEMRALRDEERQRATDVRLRNEKLEQELAAATARAAETDKQIAALSAEFGESDLSRDGDVSSSRQQFEAVLKVAEEQANVLIQNAAVQAERLLQAARDEVGNQRKLLDADVARVAAQAEHDADQVRLKVETEYTAHEARLQREGAHAGEKVAQAEREAASIRAEAEKGAAALRAMVSRETAQQRAEAERDVRDMNARVHEFEEALTRRQDDAQQEFLVLHNQAVAHAERITTDANEQVATSLAHAQRISSKAEDYEKLMRAQANQIEADAQLRARDILDKARANAQKIVDSVTGHTTTVLRDAEDRTRQLRWQQQQLLSFMAEVRELIRPSALHEEHEAPAKDAEASEPQAFDAAAYTARFDAATRAILDESTSASDAAAVAAAGSESGERTVVEDDAESQPSDEGAAEVPPGSADGKEPPIEAANDGTDDAPHASEGENDAESREVVTEWVEVSDGDDAEWHGDAEIDDDDEGEVAAGIAPKSAKRVNA